MRTTVVLESDEVRQLVVQHLESLGLKRAGGTGVKLEDDIQFIVDAYQVIGVSCVAVPGAKQRKSLGDLDRIGG